MDVVAKHLWAQVAAARDAVADAALAQADAEVRLRSAMESFRSHVAGVAKVGNIDPETPYDLEAFEFKVT